MWHSVMFQKLLPDFELTVPLAIGNCLDAHVYAWASRQFRTRFWHKSTGAHPLCAGLLQHCVKGELQSLVIHLVAG